LVRVQDSVRGDRTRYKRKSSADHFDILRRHEFPELVDHVFSKYEQPNSSEDELEPVGTRQEVTHVETIQV
jgi:hypothetical protein